MKRIYFFLGMSICVLLLFQFQSTLVADAQPSLVTSTTQEIDCIAVGTVPPDNIRVEIVEKNGMLYTKAGQLLYRFMPSDDAKVKIKFDGEWSEPWMRTWVRHWAPLCGIPIVISPSKIKPKDFNRLSRPQDSKTTRHYTQIVYRRWRLYYADDVYAVRVPTIWEAALVNMSLRTQGKDTEGKYINSGP